jgi:hypothetical protein
MPAEPRTYDVHGANRALPEVRALVSQIVELSGQLPDLQDQLRILEYGMRRPAAGPEDGDRFEAAATVLRRAEDDLGAALNRLLEMGVRLKDARVGLVDFLAHRDGELVELCWKLGEDSVSHWHRVGEGYPGRKSL